MEPLNFAGTLGGQFRYLAQAVHIQIGFLRFPARRGIVFTHLLGPIVHRHFPLSVFRGINASP
jgi:hypothetical protein